MKIVACLLAGLFSLGAYAAEPVAKPARLFPDAPPPPVALGAPDFCCTSAGRLALVNPGADGVKLAEGEACVVNSVSGKACF